MAEFLGELLIKLIPWIIPAALFYSFLMNHGYVGTGSKKSEKSEGAEKKEKKTSEKKEEPTEPPTQDE